MRTDAEESKLWGLLIGVAVVAAVGGLIIYANRHKKKSVLDEIHHVAENAKKKVSKAINEGLEELEDASEKLSKKAQKIIKKATD